MDDALGRGMSLSGEWLWAALFLVFNAAVGWCDWRGRRVPNGLLAAALAAQGGWLAAAALLPAQIGPGAAGWLQALSGGGLGLLLFLPVWRLGWMGAGDVKYLATLGWLLGPMGLIAVALAGNVSGGAHALAVRARRPPIRTPRGARMLPHATHLAMAAVGWLAWRLYGAA